MKRLQWWGAITLFVLVGTIVSLFITDWWWMMGLLILWMLLPYVALVYPLTLRKTRWIGVIGLFFVLVAFVFAGWLFAAAGIIITGTIAIIRYQDYRIRRFITPSKRVYTTSSDWLYAILIAAVGILVLLHQVETIDLLGCDDINRFLVEQSGRITSLLNKILTLAHQRHINLDDTILVYWQKYQSISQSSCNSIIVRGQASSRSGTVLIALIALSVVIYPLLMINLWIFSLINMAIRTPLVRWSGLQHITQQAIQHRIVPIQNHLQSVKK